ncbi:MAG: glycosyltransferase family 4 protein [Alphaproteobacteria bacterium]
MGGTPVGGTVAFILKGYPRLSETFITQEILGLEARGLTIAIWSLRKPTDRAVQAMHGAVKARVRYLPEYLYQEPVRVWRAWRAVRRWPGYQAARRQWLADWRRDPTPNRGRRFGQALVLAHEVPDDVFHLHAHFIHTPASVARYAAMLTGRPWSVSAHAKDIWTIPAWEKAEKLAACAFCVTCTEAGRNHLAELAPEPSRVGLVYHGLDAGRFPFQPGGRRVEAGPGTGAAIRILAVGRAVEKKGFDVLLDALARLPANLEWRLVHIGGGPLRQRLAKRADRLGLGPRIDWRGARASDQVLDAMRAADLFVAPSRIAADGDRDGLPNVLMEAASQELALIASDLPAIGEFIRDRETGRLVAPGDPGALAAAIVELARDPSLRKRLGTAARERLRRDFSAEAGFDDLARRFGLARVAGREDRPAEMRA